MTADSKTAPDPFFQQQLQAGKLYGFRCAACNRLYAPPPALCSKCHGHDFSEEPLSGRGQLVAYTWISIAPPAMAAQGFGPQNPYCCGVIELSEGPRVVARLIEVDSGRPDAVPIGAQLMARFLTAEDGSAELAFAPAADSSQATQTP